MNDKLIAVNCSTYEAAFEASSYRIGIVNSEFAKRVKHVSIMPALINTLEMGNKSRDNKYGAKSTRM